MAEPRLDTRPFELLPLQVAQRLRPYVGIMADRALAEVLQTFGTPPPGDLREESIRKIIVGWLGHFFDLIEDPARVWDRVLPGYLEAGGRMSRDGQNVETMLRMMSRTARSAWEVLSARAEALDIDRSVLALLTEAQLSYMDGVAAAISRGYESAAKDTTDVGQRRRMHLLALLLAASPADPEAVADAAREAGWTMPRTVAAGVLHARDTGEFPPASLARDVLVDIGRSEPYLVMPDPDGPGRRRLLEPLLSDWIVAVGPTVPVARAAESLGWARDALGLALRGVIPSDGLIRCADHVPTLAIFRSEELIEQVADARLAPLHSLPAVQSRRLGETLLALLQNNFNATEVGNRLHVHPQTVRQRLRLLEDLFGADLDDPQTCLELEMILHAKLSGTRPGDLDRWQKGA